VRRVREIGPEVRRQRGRGAGQTSQRRELFIRGGVYHSGLLGTFEDNDVRKQAYRSVVKVYDKARRHFRIPAERVEYLFNGLGFSAYFRKAPGITRPPCVILLRGLDAAREIELHTIANFLLEKGLSTFAIDTAGQGETRFQGMKLLPDV
jgi:2,6-dihydroxypseudooxynicotine hydrolase